MAMLKIISDSKRHGVLLVSVTMALVLVILLVFEASRSVRMAYGGKEQSSPLGSQATVNMPPQNDAASSHKPEHFPYGMAKIAFERDGVVYLYDAQTKETRRIAEGFEPDISPAGDLIAFTADRDDSLKNRSIRLFSLKTNTGGEIQSLGELHTRSPRWSHDGAKLAFDVIIDDRTHVGVLNPGTGGWDDITKGLVTNNRIGPHFNSWLPNDKSILCHDLDYLYEVAIDGSILQKTPIASIIRVSSISSASKFSFSPDRKRLLFEGFWEAQSGAVNLVVYLFDVEKHTLSTVTPKTMDATEPKWLPSGREIMFSRLEDNVGDAAIFDFCVMSVDGTTVTTIIKDASNASYSTK
jgi:Tol biopolymer transport system component